MWPVVQYNRGVEECQGHAENASRLQLHQCNSAPSRRWFRYMQRAKFVDCFVVWVESFLFIFCFRSFSTVSTTLGTIDEFSVRCSR